MHTSFARKSVGWSSLAIAAMKRKPKRDDLLVGYMPRTKTPIKMKAFNNEKEGLGENELK